MYSFDTKNLLCKLRWKLRLITHQIVPVYIMQKLVANLYLYNLFITIFFSFDSLPLIIRVLTKSTYTITSVLSFIRISTSNS